MLNLGCSYSFPVVGMFCFTKIFNIVDFPEIREETRTRGTSEPSASTDPHPQCMQQCVRVLKFLLTSSVRSHDTASGSASDVEVDGLLEDEDIGLRGIS